ncbi:substrate-binding domain-containing protein [Micromonospora globispora]|uniref:substrate-binding domain-containing protein n=1 Tax=Micromonospora globispora TaxID=1450148 RepID=UPI001402B44B|nr:substrate-binding domain-containing protein [Micromonospora globispora]
MPQIAPKDPRNVLASLPPEVAAAYNGYPTELQPSAWANWKPSHDGPYKVGILWQPVVNSFVTHTLDALTKELEASGQVEITASLAPQNPTDIPGSLQLFNQLVAKKPDIIILMPLASEPFVEAVDAAGKAGIPVVTPWLPVPSKYAIGVSLNAFLQAAEVSSRVVAEMGGKGTVLQVHGIPGIQSDNEAFAGFKAVLDQCPNVKIAGEVTGNFNAAAAKGAILQFLSTHPAKIDGVFQAGVMTPGVIQAFEQLGRPLPVIADVGSTQGSIAYAHKHADSYKQVGSSVPDGAIGKTVATVVLRMLAGDGPVINMMVTEPKLIGRDDVDAVYQDGWTVSGADDAWLPDDKLMTTEQLDAFFGTAK